MIDHQRTARTVRAALLLAAATVASACARDARSAAPSGQDTAATTAVRRPTIIDSTLPVEEELRRFRAELGPAPTALRGGASSRDALVRDFVHALERADTAALRRMALSRAEFAYLVYPESRFTRPPYRQSPGLVWFQLQMGNDAGLTRLLRRRAGKPLRYLGHDCDPTPLAEGTARLWRRCVVRSVRAAGDTATEGLFGVIVERDGQFKFASYENQY